jgi:hypothetical protein
MSRKKKLVSDKRVPSMDMDIEEKHKAIAIPVSMIDSVPMFLTVRDRRFREWLFVTGGCRKKEVVCPLKCALRELEEETRGVVNLREVSYSYFKFKTINRTPDEVRKDTDRGVKVISVYHVYIIEFDHTKNVQNHLIERFNYEKLKTDERRRSGLAIKRTHDENDFMSFDTMEEFSRKKIWDLISDNVLDNPEFQTLLHSTNRETFNIR